ncbi:lipopolysaccharide biosynthesis protein [Leptothrix sp. BB-4]
MSPGNLGQRSVAAVAWGGGGTAVRLLLQLGTQVLLARLLGPAEYGVFAIGAIVVAFATFFSDVGLAYGLIQKAEVDDRDIRFVLTWQALLGGVVTLAVVALAPWLARFFDEPRAGPVIAALAALALLNALTAPSLNLLKRRLDFRRIQIAQVLSYVAGYVLVGIPMALAGQGVWALTCSWLVQGGCNLVLMYGATRHPLRPLLWYPQGRSQFAYGSVVFATNFVNWVINNADRVIVGRFMSSRDVGLYATACNLLATPSSALLGVLQPVFFSASSRVADDRERLVRGYLTLLSAFAVFLLPAFVVLFVVARDLVALLYGPAWREVGPLLQVVALSMPFFILWGLTTPMLWTGGRARSEVLIQLPIALLWIGACLLAARHSLAHVAVAVLLLNVLRCGVGVVAVCRLLEIGLARVGRALGGGLLLALAMGLLLQGLSTALAGLAAWRLALVPLAALAIWGLLLTWRPTLLDEGVRTLLARRLRHA